SLAAAQFTNQGLYSVVVTNAQGVAVSASAQLGIIGLQAWGDNTLSQLNFSAQAYDLIAIAAGASHSLGLRADGVVVAWGGDSNGQCDVPGTPPGGPAIAGGGFSSP